MFSTAAQIKKHGAAITAFCHPRIQWSWRLKQAWRIFGQWGRVQESLEILQHLLPAKIPVFWDWAIKRVEGNHEYQITLSETASPGNSANNQDLVLTGDTIITSDGFLPNNRLSRLLGCPHEYQKDLGGWVPIRNEYFESTIPGIFIIGVMAGIRGAEAAGLEGKMAGHAVAHQLGLITQKQLRKRTRNLKLDHLRQEQFSQYLNTVFNMDSPLSKAAAEDTIRCRCEDIRAEEII